MIALENVGGVERYAAFEIDESAIFVSKKNYPQIEQCGNVINADFTPYKNFDLLIGGSPCQNLCMMGDKKGLDGEQSGLFFEYVRALKEIKPKYFLLENNASMTKENRDIITNIMQVEPVMINSVDFSAQNRRRLYWTNIPIKPWTPKHLTLKDIVEPACDKQKYLITNLVHKYQSSKYAGRKIRKTVTANIKTLDEPSNCLGCRCGNYGNNTGLIIHQDNDYYSVTPIEAERLQTIPDNYTAGIPANKRFHVIGNAWTVDVIAHIFQGLKE